MVRRRREQINSSLKEDQISKTSNWEWNYSWRGVKKLARARRGGPSHSRQPRTTTYIFESVLSLAFSLLLFSPFSLVDFSPLLFSPFAPFVFSPLDFSHFSDFSDFSSFVASAAKAAEERNMEAINTHRKRFIQ